MSTAIPLALLGTALSAGSYVGRFVEGIPAPGIMMGMIVVTLGYCVWTAVYLQKVRGESTPEQQTKYGALLGSALLCTFFTLTFLFPQLTFRVRWYDALASLGYGLLALSTWLPTVTILAFAILSLYYTFGSYHKLWETDSIAKIQLIARTLLAVFYGTQSALLL
jgi:hypothetical protein